MLRNPDAISTVLERVDNWSAPHAAAAVFDHSGILVSHGSTDRNFAVASITKIVSAWAVLVAIEEQSVRLDDPAGPEGSTVRHLLCHASGLPFEGFDPIAGPGQRRIYSNSGYFTLAEHLEGRTGMSFRDYMAEAVLEPLGMGASALVDGAAAGLQSTLEDIVSLGIELLTPRVIDPSTHAMATSVNMAGLAGVLPGWGSYEDCAWGLGPEIRGTKTPHWMGETAPASTFGHFGGRGSFLWVDPDAGFGCVVATDRAFDDWAVNAWPRFSDDLRVAVRASFD